MLKNTLLNILVILPKIAKWNWMHVCRSIKCDLLSRFTVQKFQGNFKHNEKKKVLEKWTKCENLRKWIAYVWSRLDYSKVRGYYCHWSFKICPQDIEHLWALTKILKALNVSCVIFLVKIVNFVSSSL